MVSTEKHKKAGSLGGLHGDEEAQRRGEGYDQESVVYVMRLVLHRLVLHDGDWW